MDRQSAGARDFRPIENYAVIGDCHGGALIAKDGDIDWCCLKKFDADAFFCRLLDREKGGFLSTRVISGALVSRSYVEDTNLLRTVFRSPTGTVVLTDFMPVGRKPKSSLHDYIHLNAPAWLVRRLEVIEGYVDLDVEIFLTCEFAETPTHLVRSGAAFVSNHGIAIASNLDLAMVRNRVVGATRLAAGSSTFIVVGEGVQEVVNQDIDDLLAITAAFWNEWIGYCRYSGPYAKMVRRSALVLKLLTYAPTGAMAAALTTSLPEAIGGRSNWDYRHCWIRDASLALFALSTLGYSDEVTMFYRFLHSATQNEALQIGYTIDLGRDGKERCLDHLSGYQHSSPVRVGNAAFKQQQADVYGYILEGALLYDQLGGNVSESDRRRYAALIDKLITLWNEPDQGIWELREPPKHYVHSKAMCWVAVDRAIRLLGERPAWVDARDEILRSISQNGASVDGSHLQQAYEADNVDAALLMLPMLGLPLAEKLLAGTTANVAASLQQDDLVFRLPSGDDRHEGAFVVCSFWLVNALLAQGRGEEARELFERLLERANDVGLYSEEIDSESGSFLGNFPQAFSHIGLVNCAVNLALFDAGGVDAVSGIYSDRAKRAVGSTFGLSAVVRAVVSDPSMLKLFSSSKSILDLQRFQRDAPEIPKGRVHA